MILKSIEEFGKKYSGQKADSWCDAELVFSIGGKTQAGSDFFFIQFRIIFHDFVHWHPGCHPTQNVINGYTGPFYAGPSKPYVRVDEDMFCVIHHSKLRINFLIVHKRGKAWFWSGCRWVSVGLYIEAASVVHQNRGLSHPAPSWTEPSSSIVESAVRPHRGVSRTAP